MNRFKCQSMHIEGVEKHVKNCKTTRFLAKYGGLQKKNYRKIRKI